VTLIESRPYWDDFSEWSNLPVAQFCYEQEQKRVNVDFPIWMIHRLDKEAKRLGVARQAIIKIWISERLEKTSE
jgi:predicted DNA binding CopG/RHH family protein